MGKAILIEKQNFSLQGEPWGSSIGNNFSISQKRENKKLQVVRN